MKLRICAAALILSLVASSQLSAFDGQRKGFILGVGFGVGGLFYRAPSWSHSQATFETNFKIGYAPSNSFEIYYLNIVSYFETAGRSYAGGGGLFGVTKYLRRDGNGFFFCGGAGFGYFWEMDWNTFDESGFGAFGGVGSEIGRHWSVQADVLYTSLENGARTWGFRVTLNTLAF
jgi:hypothetical protein